MNSGLVTFIKEQRDIKGSSICFELSTSRKKLLSE